MDYTSVNMKVNEIKPKQGNIDVVLDIVDVQQPRTFEKFGKPGRVATAIGKDETGDVKLSLWNDEIDKIKAGDKVHLTNGWANEWQGEIQLSAGRMGKYEVVGKHSAPHTKPEHNSQTPSAAKKDPIMTNYKSTDLEDSNFDDDINVEEESIDDDEI